MTLLFVAGPLQARRDGKEIEADKSVLSEGLKCASSGCHDEVSGSTFNDRGSVDLLGFPQFYRPGQAYNLSLQIHGTASTRVYGFQLAARFEDGSSAGNLIPLSAGVMNHELEGVGLLLHSPQPLTSGTVPFRWIAPSLAAGDVTFDVAANAANDNQDPSFDHISTNQAQVLAPLETVDSYFAQVGDGLFGDIRFRTTIILANRGADAVVELDFFASPSGEPMTVQLGDLGTASSFEIPLPAGASFSEQSAGNTAGQVGYARVRAPQGVGGTAVFSRSDAVSGVTFYESGVPSSRPLSSFSVFVDEVGNRHTGLALVNPNAQTAAVTLRLFDKQAVEQPGSPLPKELMPSAHLAKFAFELFAGLPDGFQGSLSVESDQPLAAVTLRQDDDPAQEFPQEVPLLTAFPVISDQAAGN